MSLSFFWEALGRNFRTSKVKDQYITQSFHPNDTVFPTQTLTFVEFGILMDLKIIYLSFRLKLIESEKFPNFRSMLDKMQQSLRPKFGISTSGYFEKVKK